MVLPGFPLEFDRIHGILKFDEKHFESAGLQAALDGYPVQVKVSPIKLARSEGMLPTQITAEGRITSRTLTQKLRIFSDDVFAGVAGWKAIVDIGGEHPGWRVSSNLRGMAVDLPAGYAKKAAQSVPLEVNSEPGEDLIVRVRYRQDLHALLAFADDGLRRADLYFGDGTAVLPSGTGLRIRGALDRVAVEDVQRTFSQTSTSDKQDVEPGSALVLPDWLDAVNLHVDELQIWGVALHAVNLRLPEQRPRRLWIDSDLVQGVAEPLKNKAGWAIQLDYLNLPQLPQEASAPQASSKMTPLTQVHPAQLPAVDLHVDRLNYGSWHLGALSASIRPSRDEMRLNDLRLQLPGMVLQGVGSWQERASRHVSSLQLQLTADDLGKALQYIGSPKLMDAKQAELDTELEWSAAPWQFHVQDLHGDLSLSLKDGEIYVTEMSPSSGPLMLLFSLYALPSRLSTDFGSIFSRSMVFRNISGAFMVVNGNVYTHDLKLTGPVADIKVVGRTGLAAQDFEQWIEVIPSLTVAAALAGTAAGGPLGGAAAVLGQQLLKRPLERLIELDYQLTGTWQHPELKRTAGPFNLPSLGWSP
jgi:uncharacterized protein YhdP